MSRKMLAGILLALSMLLCSCHPELSVQQYDKLKSDIAALDTERKELEAEVSNLKTELEAIEAKNNEIEAKRNQALAYVEFLSKLLSAQSSKLILSGQFDMETLSSSSGELAIAAEELEDQDIDYYLGLAHSDNQTQTVAAYYKIVEYCLKKIRQNLQ